MPEPSPSPMPADASDATRRALAAAAAALPHDDGTDAELASRGFVGTIPDATVPGVWSQQPYAFLDGDRPDTVHPGLWRQARLNAKHGLFQVTDGIFQVRGFDLSNITFVEGRDGVLVVDPLTSAEPAAAALRLYRAHRGDRAVSGVIYTHSHVDHYGGIGGVLTAEDAGREVPIVAPEGFLKAAVAENVLCGNVMGRRASYMYGAMLMPGPRGHVDCGLGKAVSRGTVGLVPPTRSISRTGERIEIDGIAIEFQMTPDTEAPAEMNFLFPDHRALCMAENCTCHLHNIYTPRGAQVRDAKSWSHYIGEAIDLFSGRYDALFASHHWPRWGEGACRDFLEKQRDLYRFVHDQTLRLANHGFNAEEAAERLRLPPSLEAEWFTRGLYGTLSHNAKAVYQRYLGWFDGNPANLNPHPPEARAQRYVAALGGAAAVLRLGRDAYAAGDYRWAAELLNHLVFADPDDEDARLAQAAALEQLGYQSESGPWRDFYLTGAMELRHPRPPADAPRQGSLRQLEALPADDLLDAISVRVDGIAADRTPLSFAIDFGDVGERYEVTLVHGVMHHRRSKAEDAVSLTRRDLIGLLSGEVALDQLAPPGPAVASDGLRAFLATLDRFDFWFNIVTP